MTSSSGIDFRSEAALLFLCPEPRAMHTAGLGVERERSGVCESDWYGGTCACGVALPFDIFIVMVTDVSGQGFI